MGHSYITESVLTALNDMWIHAENGLPTVRMERIRDAVAEYIAANDEYDEANCDRINAKWSYENGGDESDLLDFERAQARLMEAIDRRALAHARMKGETI